MAYRTSAMGHEKLLRCVEHALPDHPETFPLTSEDLPDGGICTWPGCGRDVLISAPKIDPAECETCSHPHRREITCTYVNGFWQCRCTA